MNNMTTIEERVSYIEGRLDSLATKEDLASLESRLIKWMIGMVISSVAIATTLALFIQGFVD